MEAVTSGKMSRKGRVPCLARRGGLDLWQGKRIRSWTVAPPRPLMRQPCVEASSSLRNRNWSENAVWFRGDSVWQSQQQLCSGALQEVTGIDPFIQHYVFDTWSGDTTWRVCTLGQTASQARGSLSMVLQRISRHSQILLLQVWCDHIKSKCEQGEVKVGGLSLVQPLERIGISNYNYN